jgi:hypothetical protein
LPDGIIESYEAELAALLNVNISPRYEQFRELFADSATLHLATNEELRPIVIEFIRSITWPGGLESLHITLR